ADERRLTAGGLRRVGRFHERVLLQAIWEESNTTPVFEGLGRLISRAQRSGLNLGRSQWTCKRQLVAIRIGHMEISFAPRSVLRTLRMKSFFPQVCPDRIHVRNVEDQPPPISHGMTLFQIEDEALPLFRAE